VKWNDILTQAYVDLGGGVLLQVVNDRRDVDGRYLTNPGTLVLHRDHADSSRWRIPIQPFKEVGREG